MGYTGRPRVKTKKKKKKKKEINNNNNNNNNGRQKSKGQNGYERDWLVGWLLNIPATGECLSGTDLLRQFYVLPH